jgi:hypothetical protein
MVTKEQATRENRFHEEGARRKDGSCYVWRRNGQTQTWKTRPTAWRIPVKYGLRAYGQITESSAEAYHAESACPYGWRG